MDQVLCRHLVSDNYRTDGWSGHEIGFGDLAFLYGPALIVLFIAVALVINARRKTSSPIRLAGTGVLAYGGIGLGLAILLSLGSGLGGMVRGMLLVQGLLAILPLLAVVVFFFIRKSLVPSATPDKIAAILLLVLLIVAGAFSFYQMSLQAAGEIFPDFAYKPLIELMDRNTCLEMGGTITQ